MLRLLLALLVACLPLSSSPPDKDGTTPLHYAAHFSDLEKARLLLKGGAKATAVNDYGVSVIGEAAAAGNAELVELLLNAGASANTASPEGETILMTAAQTGSLATVRLLINRGASVDARESWKGQTALMWAAAADHAEIAKMLIGHDASVNARSALVTPEVKRPANGNLVSEQPRGGLTPLLFASREGAVHAITVLAEAGADLNLAEADGITPLIMALINGHYDAAAVLIDAGANPKLADKWGRTALYAAVDMNSLEPSTTRPAPKATNTLSALDIAAKLLAKGAAPDAPLLSATPGRGIPDGPDPLLRDGTTAFIRAAKTGDVAAMKLLVAHGANPKAVNGQGVNGLMAAAGQGWRFGDSQILEADALNGVVLCVEMGLDVNAVTRRNETALHGAADRGADMIVQYLVVHGAKLDVKSATGRTPLDIAVGGEGRGHPGYPSTTALIRKLLAAANN